jgi:hypothetical protein
MEDTEAAFARQYLHGLLSWEVWLILAAGALLFWLSGWASLRLLRRTPYFPGKADLILGARWGWAGLLGPLLLSFAAQAVLLILLPWKLTLAASQGMIAAVIVLVIDTLAGKRVNACAPGLMMWLAPYNKPFATGGFASWRPFDIFEWLAWREARRERFRSSRLGRSRRWMWPLFWAVIVGCWVWCLHFLWAIDRDLTAQAGAGRMAAELGTQMADPQVVKLAFYAKMPFLDRPHPLPSSAFAKLQPDAPQEEANRVARRIEECLSRHREREVWEIVVYADRSHSEVRENYDPRTGQATPAPRQVRIRRPR